MQRKISGMSESWPVSRLMPMSWPWRSLAAYCFEFGRAKPRALPGCLRRIQMAERNQTECDQAGNGRVVTRRAVE